MSRGRIEINIFYFRGQYPILYRRAHSLIVSCVDVRASIQGVDMRIERLIRERERGEAGGGRGRGGGRGKRGEKKEEKKQRKMKQYKA